MSEQIILERDCATVTNIRVIAKSETIALSGIVSVAKVEYPPDRVLQTVLVGQLARPYPFNDNRDAGAYAANASTRTSESLTPFASPVTPKGTFAAPNKGCWIFVPASGSSL